MSKQNRSVAAVILAAGKGTRMKSQLPKVLHPILGKPMISYILQACGTAKVDRTIVVVGYEADLVREQLGPNFEYVKQIQQLGTGHALLMASEALKGYSGDILVLAGDTPFLTGRFLKQLVQRHQQTGAAATLTTAILDPTPAYGRIIRNKSGRVLRIVEERDATIKERKITEVNTSHYCFQAEKVLPLLAQLDQNNDQGEYYLTDVIQMLTDRNQLVETFTVKDPEILIGINSREELTRAALKMKDAILEKMMEHGVTIIDPASIYIEPDVKIGLDTTINPFTMLQGKTRIGKDCSIGPHVRLSNATIGNGCSIEFAVVSERKIKDGETIGPFASITG